MDGEPCGAPIRTGFDVVTEVLVWRDGAQEGLAVIVGRDDARDTILVVDPSKPERVRVVGESDHGLSHLGVLTVAGRLVLAALATDLEEGRVSIRLWDAETGGTVLEPIALPDDDAEAMTVVPLESGRSVLAVVLDERVIRVDPVTGDMLGAPLLHPENQTSAATSFRSASKEPRLVTVLSTISELWTAKFPSVTLWDPISGHLVGRFPTGHLGRIKRVVVLGHGETVAVACQDGSVRLWRFDEALGHPVPGPTGREGFGAPLEHVPEPGGSRVAGFGAGPEVDVWDLATGDHVATLRNTDPGYGREFPALEPEVVAWVRTPRGPQLVIAHVTNLTFWDPDSGDLRSHRPEDGVALGWPLHPGPGWVAVGDHEQRIILVDVTLSEVLAVLSCPEGIADVATLPDGRVVTCTATGGIDLWDPRSGLLLARHTVGAEVRGIAALPDGSLALGLMDGWSIVTLPATNPG